MRLESQRRGRVRTIITVFIALIILFGTFASYFLYEAIFVHNASASSSNDNYVTEYVISKSASPNGIAVDAQGNAWFVDQSDSSLGVLFDSNSTIREFRIPASNVSSWDVAVDNFRHFVWFGDDTNNAIWSFNILNGTFHEHMITTSNDANPEKIVLDSHGDVWFSELFANKIGEIELNGTLTDYKIPPPFSNVTFAGPVGIAISSNGTIWFTETLANGIGSFYGGVFHEFNLTGLVLEPVGIVVDSQGNVWITQHAFSMISEFNPKYPDMLSSFSTSLAPQPLVVSLPYFIYIDSQGNLWFNEHQGNRIGRFSPSTDSMIEYNIPTKILSAQGLSGALTMSLSTSGIPWFAEQFAGKIGTVNIQDPINQSISVQTLGSLTLGQTIGSNVQINLNVQTRGTLQTNLNASISALTYQTLAKFSFWPDSGNGNSSSTFTFENEGLTPGTYYVTIGVSGENVVVSRIVEIAVT